MAAMTGDDASHLSRGAAGHLPDDGVPRRWPAGVAGTLASGLCVGLSLYALYWVLFIVQPQVYRVSFLLLALSLTFLLFPFSGRMGRRVSIADWLLVAATAVSLGWPLATFHSFVYRAADPTRTDLMLGTVAILLVLEAARRSVGWILPATAIAFLVYAYAGPAFDRLGLPLLAHRGYDISRLVGTLYMTLEGIFGVPLDVAATYIVLFTIYGAVLEHSGAGEFFINWSMAAMGGSSSGAAPGRTVTLAGFLLGTVSGSGVATTVMLGSVSWPLLRRAGYKPETGGAILSAAGIGALLSPPTLGAAAFLIAEFLQISYLHVLVMATIPTLLYYLSIFLMIEADSRRLRTHAVDASRASAGKLTRRYWYHFTSLAAVAILMVAGMTAFRAVFWATLLAIALSFVRRESALTPRKLFRALRSGGADVLGVAATTATAGVIVGVVTLTGLGLKMAGIIVTLAGGHLFLTVAYSAIAVWLLGLAVPVTASYIIAAVMVAPALVTAGVAPLAAHMFIFYYAVLSEVSPPTALSPFAAAAITGGNPFRTMMLTWKYTLPAFLVPFVFSLNAEGMGILLQGPLVDVVSATATAALGVAALAAGFGGWIRTQASGAERTALVCGGLLLFYADRWSDIAGFVITAVVLILHFFQRPAGTPVDR
jgi:TRAP transporter 4TM/12TM fusion protein